MNITRMKVGVMHSIFVASLLITACASNQPHPIYQHVTPITPADNDPENITTIATTHPTFRWTDLAANDPSTKYSLAIWAGDVAETSLTGSVPLSSSKGPVLMRGELIFKKDQIQGTKLTPDVNLIPGRSYFWSVRQSNGTEWAEVLYEMDEHSMISGGHSSSRTKRMFLFRISDPK
jgi:hypothetical protein